MAHKHTPAQRASAYEDLLPLLEEHGLPPVEEWTVELMVTHEALFGLDTATPCQRAICRVVDGRSLGELWEDADVRWIMGGALPPDGERPREVVVLAAIRSFKSLLAAAIAVLRALTCDIGLVKKGESPPKIPILSVAKDNAMAVFSHVRGKVMISPVLRHFVAKKPTAMTLTMQHLSGIEIDIRVVAGARGGTTLESFWLASAIFDEAPKMQGQEDGVVNLDDAKTVVQGRILEGGQLVEIGSPWAPLGPLYEQYSTRWGKPGVDLVVIRATGPQLNPYHWTPERCDTLKRDDIKAYRINCLAEFADPESTLISSVEIAAVTREGPEELPPCELNSYVAAMDPAARKNSWTLTLTTCLSANPYRYAVVLTREWKPDPKHPFRPRDVLKDIARVLKPYGVARVLTDQFMVTSLMDLAEDVGLQLVELNQQGFARQLAYDQIRVHIQQHLLELPPNEQLRRDLLSLKKRLTADGFRIVLPATNDGRHCDLVPPIALTLTQPPDPPVEEDSTAADPRLERHLERMKKPDGWLAGAVRGVLGR